MTTHDPGSGAPLGRYREFELLEKLGSGAFATVYKVRAPGHDVPVALKLAAQTRLSPETIQRAIREVAVLRSLTNPHVVRLHGSSIGPDHFYVLMDCLQGKQLDHHHDFDTAMDAGAAVDIALQACMGLCEAHAEGVVHRDIKPANIWLEPGGTVKLLDFGLARAWGVPWAFGANATAARTLVGTPHYCQPEQLESATLTPASDVYSLGTILYELLCGRAVLFEDQPVSLAIAELRDNPIAWLQAHVRRPMVPIARYRTDLPWRLRALLRRALAKDPKDRPRDAAAMANVLGDVLVLEFGAARPAHVRVGDGGPAARLSPGRRILGRGPGVDVAIEDSGVAPQHAIIDWSGSPRVAQLRPVGAARLTRNGHAVAGVVAIEHGDVFGLGNTRFELAYPGE